MSKILTIASILGAIFITTSFAEEKSAYGAGDITESNPYGLTKNEEVFLKNSRKVDNDLATIQNRVNILEEQIEGMLSVLDGTNSRTNDIDQKLREFKGDVASDLNSSDKTKDLKKAFRLINENRKIQKTNNTNIKKVLTELSSLIDSINTNYVPKDKFEELAKRVDALDGKKTSGKSTPIVKTKAKKIQQKTQISSLSGKDAFKKANTLFANKSFDEAKNYFQQAIEKKYKPATSNYFIGESYYAQKSWADAISSYKKSVELYDKSSYMPRLLYHTAISFDKLKDKENANKFYHALKRSYPDSREAKAAPDRK